MASLFGGPLRTQIPSYWSHAGTFRVGQHAHLGTEPLTDLEGVRALGEEVRERGFKALKTNLFVLGGEDGPSHIYVRPLPLSPALSGQTDVATAPCKPPLVPAGQHSACWRRHLWPWIDTRQVIAVRQVSIDCSQTIFENICR